MIRITSQMPYALKVPYLTPRGVKPRFFEIPPMLDGEPGVLELAELDNITIERLRWHYDWRPTDPKNKGKSKEDLLTHDPESVAEIGLLKIEVVAAAERTKKQAPAPQAGAQASAV